MFEGTKNHTHALIIAEVTHYDRGRVNVQLTVADGRQVKIALDDAMVLPAIVEGANVTVPTAGGWNFVVGNDALVAPHSEPSLHPDYHQHTPYGGHIHAGGPAHHHTDESSFRRAG